MKKKAEPPAGGWPPMDWAGHERVQRRRYARLTLAEKLAWLERAHHLARQLAGARASRRRGAAGV